MDDPTQHATIIHARLPATSVGRSGSIRSHCASENQKKSDISPPFVGAMNHVQTFMESQLLGLDPRYAIRKDGTSMWAFYEIFTG